MLNSLSPQKQKKKQKKKTIKIKGLNRRFYGFGQSSVLICPNTTIHPEYNIGTFSGMIYGVVATSFEIEIVVSPQVLSKSHK